MPLVDQPARSRPPQGSIELVIPSSGAESWHAVDRVSSALDPRLAWWGAPADAVLAVKRQLPDRSVRV